MKQYYAVVDKRKRRVLGMSPKTSTSKDAIKNVLRGGEHKGRGPFQARPLGTNKIKASEELTKVEKEIDALRRTHEQADIAIAERYVREALVKLVAGRSGARTAFLDEFEKPSDYAYMFNWGYGSSLIAADYKADVAQRVLNQAKEKPERHLFDWLFIAMRYELKLCADERHDSSRDPWRAAVASSQSEARRGLINNMSGGLTWVLYRGQECVTAREELSMAPPPWTKIDMALVKADWPVAGFEPDAKG